MLNNIYRYHKMTFVILLHNSYIANREATQIQAVFEQFLTKLGQKWQYLKSTLELNLQIWESETLMQVPYPPENKPPFFSSRHDLWTGEGAYFRICTFPRI